METYGGFYFDVDAIFESLDNITENKGFMLHFTHGNELKLDIGAMAAQSHPKDYLFKIVNYIQNQFLKKNQNSCLTTKQQVIDLTGSTLRLTLSHTPLTDIPAEQQQLYSFPEKIKLKLLDSGSQNFTGYMFQYYSDSTINTANTASEIFTRMKTNYQKLFVKRYASDKKPHIEKSLIESNVETGEIKLHFKTRQKLYTEEFTSKALATSLSKQSFLAVSWEFLLNLAQKTDQGAAKQLKIIFDTYINDIFCHEKETKGLYEKMCSSFNQLKTPKELEFSHISSY